MATYNKIDQTRYLEIKAEIEKLKAHSYDKLADLDKTVADTCGVGTTTARNVRNTPDFQAYCERVFRYNGNPRKTTPARRVIRPSWDELDAGLKNIERSYLREPDCDNASMISLVLLFGCVLISGGIMVGLVFLIVQFLGGGK